MNLAETESFILRVAQYFLAHIRTSNFGDLFKLSARQVANYMLVLNIEVCALDVRDLLIFLLWCRHYLPFRSLAVLFHLGKTMVHRIVRAQLDALKGQLALFVTLSDISPMDDFALRNTVGIVDATEIFIERKTEGSFYSGKKKRYTVKYQVVTDIESGVVIHVAGPYPGSMHDAKMYRDSLIGDYLAFRDYYVLGDKGYQGCGNVYYMRKKQRGQAHLSPADRTYNNTISAKRVEIEQFFGSIKDWKVINHVFRGDLASHGDIFSCCLILAHFSKL